MRAQFYCDSCDAQVPFNAERCPACGKHFTAVKCPQCAYEGKPKEFSRGCPVCGYLTDELVAAKRPRAETKRAASPLTGKLVRVLTVVLLVALAVLVDVLLRL